jgi:glycerophosphoryl diester phosphodiesterase
MLDIKDVSPALALGMVRRAGVLDRVVVLTFSAANAQLAFNAPGDALISCLVTKSEDLHTYRAMAGNRRFAAYVPRTLPSALFVESYRAGGVVITDMLSPAAISDAIDPSAGVKLAHQSPIGILVTNTPLALQGAFRGP